MTYQDDLAEVRRNIADHERTEKARIDRLVKEASKSTEAWASEQEAATHQAEQQREAAQLAREAKKEADARKRRSASICSPVGCWQTLTRGMWSSASAW